MIDLTLIPVRPLPQSETPTEISVAGDVISISGIDFDLSLMADGDSVTHPILGRAIRSGGDYQVFTKFNVTAGCPDFSEIDLGAVPDGPVSMPEFAIEEADNELAE